MNAFICLLMLVPAQGWGPAWEGAHVTVASDGWLVKEIVSKTAVLVEGREFETDGADILIARTEDSRVTVKHSKEQVRARELAVVLLSAREVKKIKVGERILATEELWCLGRRRLQTAKGFSAEPLVYSKEEPKTSKKRKTR
jgi:hypothetical protein